jgi:mono/diheme cytochrome c family protein
VSCHTDDEGGGQPLAGGVALSTKFGTFFTPNITPDQEDGIGSWSIEDFARAVRHGASPDDTPYYPAFPYPFYASLNDRDIADIWAALHIVPPDPTPSKPHDLDFPYSIRAGLKLWRAVFPPPSPYRPNPEKSASWNRGKLIAQGLAHCGACHTPRNAGGARIIDRAYAGDPYMLDGGSSPSITAAALREQGWEKTDLIRALTTGVTPEGDVFGGTMAEVVRDGTACLIPMHGDDLATYLLDAE